MPETSRLEARQRVIPKGPGPKRQKGHPKPVVTLRPPKDLEDYLDAALARGNPKTELIIDALRIYRDAMAAMGAEWWEMERRAKVSEMSVGALLGRLVIDGMYCEKKGSKKSH